MKKALFIDRDGTIIVEPLPDRQIDSLEKLSFVPGAIGTLRRIAEETDYELVMVTNQDGLGTASFPEDTFWPAHNKMLDTLAGEGVRFAAVHIDRSLEHQQLPTRKPGTALLTHYLAGEYDLAASYVIGDRHTDVQLARNLGARSILLCSDSGFKALEGEAVAPSTGNGVQEPASIPDAGFACTARTWEEIYQHLRLPARVAEITRNTRETQISVVLNLDGTGQSDLHTGLGFFDHMLDQLAKHSGADLHIQVAGDLHIDEHHTIEDTALALGEAYAKALGDKRGTHRYGFLLPMDEALAQVAIDFSGRPWLVWGATFRRERIGEMPTEMFFHFFKSFSDAARCNLNIKVEGDNEHHKIESIFKAFAKAIKMAVARDLKNIRSLPSTKGVL